MIFLLFFLKLKNQDFLASTQKMYGAELASVDFQHASEGARKAINEWVEGQTEGKRLPSFHLPACRPSPPFALLLPRGKLPLPSARQLSSVGIPQSGNFSMISLKQLNISPISSQNYILKLKLTLDVG